MTDEIQRLKADSTRCRKLFGNWWRDLPEYTAIMCQEIKKLEAEHSELEKFCRQIEENIASLRSNIERMVLQLRYMRGLTWERTAEEMNYSVQSIYKIHARTLDALTMEDKE